jgi:chitodextrinase
MTPTSRIDANTMKGAFINDPTTPEIVMFSSHPQGADVTSVTYQANYASSLTGKHLLLDMSPGTYDVYKNGTIILSGITASSQGVLSFSSTGGSTFQVVQTGSTPTEDTTSPSNPTNLIATTISSSQIDLSWNVSTDNVGVAGYKIFRNGMQITTTTNTAYSDTSLSPSTTYTYAVSAYDATANESGQSNQATATTLSESSQDTESPSTPTSLSATTISSSQINLSWDASTDNVGVTGYKIFRNGTQITTATNTTYSDTILFPSTTYTYAVSAYDAAGNESAKSTFVSVTTLADTNPPTITSVSASGDPTNVTVVFSEPVEQASATNAANYQIDNGSTVSSASLNSDLKTVTLTTSPHNEEITYRLTVNNVRDRAANPKTITPDTTASYQYIGMNIFDADSEGWAYFDDTFRSTINPSSADGHWDASEGNDGGTLVVALGDNTKSATSGGWAKSVSITESYLSISFDYKLDLLGTVDRGEYGEVIVSVDDNQVGILSNDYVVQLEGNGRTLSSTGWVTVTVTAANIGAGSHEVIIGGYMSGKSSSSEKAVVYIDNVKINVSAPIDTTPPATPTGLTTQ